MLLMFVNEMILQLFLANGSQAGVYHWQMSWTEIACYLCLPLLCWFGCFAALVIFFPCWLLLSSFSAGLDIFGVLVFLISWSLWMLVL